MKAVYVMAILFGSLLFVGIASAGDDDLAQAVPSELAASAPELPEAEVTVTEGDFPEINAGDVAWQLSGGDSQLKACDPDDPNYCESIADCPPGCRCRLFCCID